MSISKNFIFKENGDNLIFVGDFDGLYLNDENPWGQDGSDYRLGKYYEFSRKQILKIIKELTFLGQEKLLEVGCGLGHVVDFLAKNSLYEVSGADISKEAIKKASFLYPEYEFNILDIQSKNLYHDKQYEVIILNQALWYVIENFKNVFINISNMLSSNGIFIIVNAFTDEQKYGKDIINGFGGLVSYIEEKQNLFEISIAKLYKNQELLYKDGIVVMKKRLNA